MSPGSRQLSNFEHFSTQLYCSGATEQLCRVDGEAVASGQCYWRRSPDWRATTLDDVNVTNKPRFPRDRWDPREATDAKGFHKYGPESAAACARGRRILVAGDSTTRDTFYELLAVVGHPINVGYPTDPRQYWGANDFEPRQLPAAGGDKYGGAPRYTYIMPYLYMSIYRSICLCVCLSIYLSVCIGKHTQTHAHTHASIYLSTVSIHLSIHPSIYRYM